MNGVRKQKADLDDGDVVNIGFSRIEVNACEDEPILSSKQAAKADCLAATQKIAPFEHLIKYSTQRPRLSPTRRRKKHGLIFAPATNLCFHFCNIIATNRQFIEKI